MSGPISPPARIEPYPTTILRDFGHPRTRGIGCIAKHIDDSDQQKAGDGADAEPETVRSRCGGTAMRVDRWIQNEQVRAALAAGVREFTEIILRWLIVLLISALSG
jgi:hypothetical protein